MQWERCRVLGRRRQRRSSCCYTRCVRSGACSFPCKRVCIGWPLRTVLVLHFTSHSSALEGAEKWRKAESVYTQLHTLTTRLLGRQHKAAKAAAMRAKRAAARAATRGPETESPEKEMAQEIEAGSPGGEEDGAEDVAINGNESWLLD